VVEIETSLPKRSARKRVELGTAGVFGKDGRGDRNMAPEHAGEAVAHFLAWFADDDGPGDIGGTVLVLRAGIDQK
jgi:hypothetical protein